MRICIFIMVMAVGMLSAYTLRPSVPEGEFLIQGELKNVPDGTVIKLEVSHKGLMETIISDTLKNGKFSFRDTISSLRNLMIGSMDLGFPPLWLEIWIAPGSYTRITGDGKLLLSWRVESDIPEQLEENSFVDCSMPEQMQMMAYMAEEYDFLKNVYWSGKKVDKALQEEAWVKIDSLRNLEQPLRLVITNKELAFMKEAPVSQVWMNKMLWFSSLLHHGEAKDNRAKLEELYNRIPEEYKQSVTGQTITKYLFPLPPVNVGDQMVDGDLYDVEGKLHHLSEFKGRYILLDFWSMGCGPCFEAISEIEAIGEKYADKLAVVSICENPEPQWKEYVAKEKMGGNQWNELLPGRVGLSSSYQVKGIPHFVLIAPNGIIQDMWCGYSKGTLEEKMKGLVSK